MSTLKVNNLKNVDGTRTLASDSGTAWSWGTGVPKGSVIEEFMSPCDGSSITVQSGSYTVQNVTARQLLTSSYVDVTGSVIDYTPPTGTQTVIYTFNFQFSAVDAHNVGHFKLYLDNDSGTPTEVTSASSSFGAENWNEVRSTYTWAFHIGGSDNDATGRRDTWTSARTIKLQGIRQSGSNEPELHYTEYTTVLAIPVIGIKALA